jgi:spermidine synthase
MTRIFIYAIAILSGMAGLSYQITWSRMFAIGLGHEFPGVLALITAFFGGLAAGSWLLDRRIALSKSPAAWYVLLELLIAAWVLITIGLIPLANGLAQQWIGPRPHPVWHWGIAWLLPLVTLLPATIAMGATLPAMDRFAAPWFSDRRVVGGLYGANTLGAVLGTLLSAFWINAAMGYSRSLLLFATVNLICAILVGWRFLRPASSGPLLPSDPGNRSPPIPLVAPQAFSPEITGYLSLGMTAFFTGLLGIGYEVVGVRYLGTLFNNTVYTYASTLSVFLLGTAAGGIAYQTCFAGRPYQPTLTRLLLAVWGSCLVGMLGMANARQSYALFREWLTNPILAEIGVSLLVFAVPTFCMGLVFSHLSQSARTATGGVGRTMALNTLGSAFAPLIFGIVLIPEIGLKWSLMLLCFAYLLLIPVNRLSRFELLFCSGIFLILAGSFQLNTLRINPPNRLLIEKPGMLATVAVVQTPRGDRGLRVNNHYAMGGTSNPEFEQIQGVFPILLHPQPLSALFLGIGTGITLGTATVDPQLRVTGVELVPEVVEVLPFFFPENRLHQAAMEILTGDARRFIRATSDRYDLIVGDLFHPGRDGAGSLFTVEHFRAIQQALTDDGVACIWLPSYQLDSPVFKMVVRSFLEVFPDASAVLGQYRASHLAIGLVSDSRYLQDPLEHWQRRTGQSPLLAELHQWSLHDPLSWLGRVVADTDALREYAGAGPLNTDDLPLVTYLAPDYVYAGYPRRWERYQELQQYFTLPRRQALAQRLGPGQSGRLLDFWSARDQFLLGMTMSQPGKIEQLLSSIETSREFPEAYREALKMGRELVNKDLLRQASGWLKRVLEVDPEWGEGLELLAEIEAKIRQLP